MQQVVTGLYVVDNLLKGQGPIVTLQSRDHDALVRTAASAIRKSSGNVLCLRWTAQGEVEAAYDVEKAIGSPNARVVAWDGRAHDLWKELKGVKGISLLVVDAVSALHSPQGANGENDLPALARYAAQNDCACLILHDAGPVDAFLYNVSSVVLELEESHSVRTLKHPFMRVMDLPMHLG